MALYAGMIHPKRGDVVEVEFQIPSHARLPAIIRSRACFSFGLQFLVPVLTDDKASGVAQLAAFALKQGREAEAALSASAAGNAASAHAMLAQVLRLEGQPVEAQIVEQAVVLFLRMRDIHLRQEALGMKRLRRQLGTMCRAALLLADYQRLLKPDAVP
jgi:hypothetical protein